MKKKPHKKELHPDIQRVANDIAEAAGHPKPYPQSVFGDIMENIGKIVLGD